MRVVILLFSFFFFFVNMVFGDDVLKVNNRTAIYDVSEHISYYVDSTSQLTIDDFRENNELITYQQIESSTVNVGVSKYPHWFVFDVENCSSSEEWILEIDYPTLDEVIFYFLDTQNNIDTIIYSGKKQVDQQGLSYTYSIVLTSPFPVGETQRVFVKVLTDSFIILPIKIMSAKAFIDKDRKEFSFLYVVYGIILALVVFNFILFLLTRELNYLLLTLYLATLSLNAYYMYGYGFDLFPNLDIFLKSRMRQILFGLGSATFLFFSINYLDLKKYKTLYRIILALIATSIVYTVSLFFRELPQAFFSKYSPMLYLSGAIINFYAGIYTYRKGERLALYYIISFSFVTIAAIIYYLTLFNLIPFNQVAFNINSLGTVLFGMLLTIGLIEKITAIRQEKAKSSYLETIVNKLNTEIDERNKVEKALRESEEKFRLLFDLSPQPVSLTQMETGLIIEVNHQMEKITGLTKEELIGKTSLELEIITAKDRDTVLDELEKKSDVSGLEIILHSVNGALISCLAYIHAVRIQDRNILISVFSDISDLKKKQQEIHKLSIALEQSANTIIITNLDGVIEYANPAMQRLTGYSPSEVIGQKMSIFKTDYFPRTYYETLWKKLINGYNWSGEFYNRKKNGDFFWDSSTITPVYDDTGAMCNFIAIKEDITEKKQQQEALLVSEKQLRELNATKDKFFSIIAHDLMNPFNAILGFNQLLIESIKSENHEESLNFATIIDQSTLRIFNLLQNLLVWSRTQSGKISFKPITVKIAELIMNATSVLTNFALNKQIEFEISISEDDAVRVDQNMIETVLRNLISNAIKFSDSGAKVKIAVQKFDTYYLFSVKDSGVGMDKGQQDELFKLEKSTITKGTKGEVGTGLGLVLCYDFIHAHNGQIWAESELKKGSSFFFTVPITNSDVV